MLATNSKIIKGCRPVLAKLFKEDIDKYIDLFFYEKEVSLDNAVSLEQAGVISKGQTGYIPNVMVFPYKEKFIVTDFLLSVRNKENGKFKRGLDDIWVMFPHETLLFIDRLDKVKGKVALDIASGSGAISLFLADRFEKVVSADINPKAVKYERFNAILNNKEDRIVNIESNLFQALKGQKFDYICWNGPTVALPEVDEPKKVYPLYTYGGFDGAEFTKRFLDEVLQYTNQHYKIKWWDGSLGDAKQSVVEKYIIEKFSSIPLKVTIEFLNKRRGVPITEYTKLYDKYCLDSFDLNQGVEREAAALRWSQKLSENKLTKVYISLISIEPSDKFEIIYKDTERSEVGPKEVFGFEWHYVSRKYIKDYLLKNER